MGRSSYPRELYRNSQDYAGTHVKLICNGETRSISVTPTGSFYVPKDKVCRPYLWAKVHDFNLTPDVHKFKTRVPLIECINTGEILPMTKSKHVVCAFKGTVLLRSEAEEHNNSYVTQGWSRVWSSYRNFCHFPTYTKNSRVAFKKRYPTKLDFGVRIQEILDKYWDGDINNIPEGYHLHHNHMTGEAVNFWPGQLNRIEGNLSALSELDNNKHIEDAVISLLDEYITIYRSNRKE